MRTVILLLLLFQLPSPQPPQLPSDRLPAPQTEQPRPTPQQGVPTTRAVATVNMFFNQSAPTLATIQSYYSYAYKIDGATSGIALTATCADMTPPQTGLFACNGPMTTLVTGTHQYVLEVTCSTCADPKTAASGAATYTYSGGSTVQAASLIMIESGDSTNIPPQTIIVDAKGAQWSQSSQVPASCPAGITGHPPADCLSQLRNGVVISLGSQIFYKNKNIYSLGPDGQGNSWWQFLNNPGCPGGTTAQCWTNLGPNKPTR